MKLNLPLRPILELAIMTCTLVAGLVMAGYFRPHEQRKIDTPNSSTAPIDLRSGEISIVEEVHSVNALFTKEDTISYSGFTLTRRNKMVSIEGKRTEVSYAVLKKDTAVVATFDGKYNGTFGNETNFGLFDFLGDGTYQFVIDQSTNRDGRFWIINLSPKWNTVFDSADYGLTDGFNFADFDHDGVYELMVTSTAFYNFADVPHCCPPEVNIIFKYDSSVQKYLPANHLYVDEALAGIDDRIDRVNEGTDQDHRRNVLTILLRYLYAGKETEGWAFFDREYQKADKEKLRSQVRSKLATDPIYRFIDQTWH
ncbi:MAG: hypothetical protein ABIP75_17720 [Pyrinomonadaceae bacterium]